MRAAWPLLRWTVVVVPLVDVALALTGVLDPRSAVLAGVALEALLLGVVVLEVRAFRRGYRRARVNGGARSAAASAGLELALPAPVAWFVRAEAGIARALWRAVRGRRDVGPDVELSYTDRIGLMLWTTVGLGVLETTVVHLLVRQPTVRWVLLAVSLYGLLWLVGLACSLRQHPHLLGDEALVLRFAHLRSTRVPLTGLIAVRRDVRTGHRHNVERLGDTLSLSVAGETDVELSFDPEVEVEVRGRTGRYARVRFFADDHRAAVRLLTERALSRR